MSRLKISEYLTVKYSTIETLSNAGVKNGTEILLYALIESLSKKDRHCTASNEYMAKVLHCSERSIQNYLRHLKECGLVKMYNDVGAHGTARTIYPQIMPINSPK